MNTHNETLVHPGHGHAPRSVGAGSSTGAGNSGHGHGHHDHHDDHDHDHDDDGGASHSTLRGYLTGFVLSVILTVIPFWIVMGNIFENATTTSMVVLGLAAVQIVVHMIYFLHMNFKSEGGWNMLALIFTIMVVVITLAGSLWVMYHLNTNMMPTMTHEMK